MELELNDAQIALKDGARNFARTEIAPSVAERDSDARFDRALFAKLAGHGLLGAPMPQKYGGRSLGGIDCALLLEGFGEGATDVGFASAWITHTFACAVPIWRHGTDAQKSRYLPALANGRAVGAASLSGPDDGFDVRHIPIDAAHRQGRFVLNGTSKWVVNAPNADVILMASKTNGTCNVFLIDARAPGVRVEPPRDQTGQRTMAVADVVLTDCEVSMEDVLGDLGGGLDVVRTALAWQWAMAPAPWVGILDALNQHIVAYAKGNAQFARAIADFQIVRAQIVDARIRAETARRMVYRAAALLDLPDSGAAEAAAARLFVAGAAQKSILDAVHTCAAEAREHGALIERLYRDSMLLPVHDNAVHVMRSIVASGFLDLVDRRASA